MQVLRQDVAYLTCLAERPPLRGLRTRAFPTGVDCPPAPINHEDSSNKLCRAVYQAHPAKEIHGDSYGRTGLGETTQCVAQGRLISRPWKAECISVAVFCFVTAFIFTQRKSTVYQLGLQIFTTAQFPPTIQAQWKLTKNK